jgi:organic radical activating enzyme
MKWNNRGHEFDIVAEKLLQNQEKFRCIYIFGAGLIGANLTAVLQAYGILAGFIDNDIKKQHEGYKGYAVYSFEEYRKEHKGFIVIAASDKNIPPISKQLEDADLSEEQDFVTHTKFCNEIFPIVSVYLFSKVYIDVAQISLTERCSLKCRKCAHGCFAVDNSRAKDLTIEQVYKSADSFFGRVDFVREFVLIGGEPMLYKQLPEAVQYIGERYGKQIGVFSITTNGTILPDEKLLRVCNAQNVLFRISNYSGTIARLKNTYNMLTKLLDQNGVAYELGMEEKEWMDYGFDCVDRIADADELIRVFDTCKTPCREVRENRYYFCVMARSVSDNMGFHIGKDDFLDLDVLTGEQYKKEFMEFNFGYSDKGYLDMCRHCNGADSAKYPIPAAEQVDSH